ncbi:MAG: 2-C-methyl-D-erythritol 4-phosphate cytidylyltransferase [Desulfomonilaceae bacterium]
MIYAAIVTAGGIGSRMGKNIPKQFLKLGGIPILALTLKVFENHPEIDFIVLTTPERYIDYCKSQIIQRYGFQKVRHVIQGSVTRQGSVLNGLKMAEDSDFVLIHDGVRPLIEASVISMCIEAVKVHGAAISASPINDTVKRGAKFIAETISRENLWLAHTPQAFRRSLILHAHEKALADNFVGTDDASLVERLGVSVAIVQDSNYNIKITSPEDLLIAEQLSAIRFP